MTLLLEDFCKTKRVEKTVHIDEDISAVQFKVDLNEMLGQRTSIRPDDLTIVLTDPHGDTISSRDGKFLFNTTSDGLVVTASYFQDAPSQGDWTILVEGGRDICGHLKVTARVPFIAVMELMPEMSTYYGDDVVSVKFGLKNQDNDLSVPMEDVTGHFRFSPAEAGGARIQEQSIDFTVSGDGNFAEADLRVPTGIKGSAAVETAIVDRRYRSTIKDFRSINVVPDRRQVMIDAEPEKVSLGIVGDDVYKVDSVPITLTTSTPTISFEVNCIKPRLMYGGVEIPIEWTKVTPSSGVMSIENPLTVQISVSLPENVPLTLPQGVYKGELEVEPKTVKMADGYGRIPVELQVTIPEIIAEPSKIGYDFKWRLGAPVVRQIKIGHTSADERSLDIILPRLLKDKRGIYQKSIVIDLPDSEDQRMDIFAGDMDKVKIGVRLTNTSLKKRLRIPRGIYRGEIILRGPGMKPKSVGLSVKIPEKPLILYLRPAGLALIGIFACLALIGIIRFLLTNKKSLFKGASTTIEKDGLMDSTVQEKFECTIRRKTVTDPDTGLERPKYELIACDKNNQVSYEDISGDCQMVPSNGIADLENHNDSPVEKLKTPQYTLELMLEEVLELKVIEGPYGTALTYLLKKVIVWILLGAAAGGITLWIYQLV